MNPTINAAALRHATLAVPAPRPAYIEILLASGETITRPIDGVERIGTGPESHLVIHAHLQEELKVTEHTEMTTEPLRQHDAVSAAVRRICRAIEAELDDLPEADAVKLAERLAAECLDYVVELGERPELKPPVLTLLTPEELGVSPE